MIVRLCNAGKNGVTTVAIVDDSESMRRLTARILEREGWEVAAFASGDLFLADPESSRFASVLLDLNMPGADALSVLRAVRERPDPPPILVLAGHGGIPRAVEAMKLGAADFLEKPFEAKALTAAISRAIEARAQSGPPARPSRDALAAVETLSQRQRDVLCGILNGDPNKVIAYQLTLSIRTVEAYRAQLLQKLGVRSAAGAVRMALAADLDCSSYGRCGTTAR
jgi:two-component system response regulator FixJ